MLAFAILISESLTPGLCHAIHEIEWSSTAAHAAAAGADRAGPAEDEAT